MASAVGSGGFQDLSKLFGQQEQDPEIQQIVNKIEDDINGINQAVQYAGQPAEDQDPDALLPWNDASSGA